MTREELQVAIDEGIPFVIKMADGEKYEVSNRYEIALGKRAVVVIDKNGLPHFLPMLTMTGITSLNDRT
jgi:hypothetical protein